MDVINVLYERTGQKFTIIAGELIESIVILRHLTKKYLTILRDGK